MRCTMGLSFLGALALCASLSLAQTPIGLLFLTIFPSFVGHNSPSQHRCYPLELRHRIHFLSLQLRCLLPRQPIDRLFCFFFVSLEPFLPSGTSSFCWSDSVSFFFFLFSFSFFGIRVVQVVCSQFHCRKFSGHSGDFK